MSDNTSAFIPLIRAEQVQTLIDYIKDFEPKIVPQLNQLSFPAEFQKGDYVSRAAISELLSFICSLLPEQKIAQMLQVVCKVNSKKILQNKAFSGTVLKAINDICAQLQYDSTDSLFFIKSEHGQTWFCRTRANEAKLQEEITILMMIQLVRNFTGTTWLPEKIWLNSCDNRDFQSFLPLKNIQFFCCQETTAILLPNDFATRLIAIPQQKQCQTDVTQLQTFKYSLKVLLETYISGEKPSIKQAASYSNLSVRTIQRRLKKESVTYSEVVDELIHELACDALVNTTESITDLAYRLGYSYSSHFSRAFKRMTDQTPQQYRDQFSVL